MHAAENRGVATTFAGTESTGSTPNEAAEKGIVSRFDDNVRPTGSATADRRAFGSEDAHDATSGAKSTMPSVEAADRNNDTETHDEGSVTRNARRHTASEFKVALRRPTTPATSDRTTIIAARTAETGTPEKARYANTNATLAATSVSLRPARSSFSSHPKTMVTMARWAPDTATTCASPHALNAS